MMQESENISKCRGCGGNLVFSPEKQDLQCTKCGRHEGLAKIKGHSKHDYLQSNPEADLNWQAEGGTYRCKSCGCEVTLTGSEITKTCPYCGSGYVAEIQTLAGLKPDQIIPFAFSKNEALQIFKKGVKKKHFVPSAFKKNLPESKINGLYIPCFSFDADMNATYRGMLEEDYTTRDKDGNMKTQTRSFPIAGNFNANMRDIVVEAGKNMSQDVLQTILPYDHNKACEFDAGYLRGYFVEHYSDSLEESHEQAKNVMSSDARKEILSKYHYDRVTWFELNPYYSNEKYAYKFVPVYKFEYTYKNKKYITSMNGQTGQFQNNLPKSGWKIFGLVLGILAMITGIIAIFFLLR